MSAITVVKNFFRREDPYRVRNILTRVRRQCDGPLGQHDMVARNCGFESFEHLKRVAAEEEGLYALRSAREAEALRKRELEAKKARETAERRAMDLDLKRRSIYGRIENLKRTLDALVGQKAALAGDVANGGQQVIDGLCAIHGSEGTRQVGHALVAKGIDLVQYSETVGRYIDDAIATTQRDISACQKELEAIEAE